VAGREPSPPPVIDCVPAADSGPMGGWSGRVVLGVAYCPIVVVVLVVLVLVVVVDGIVLLLLLPPPPPPPRMTHFSRRVFCQKRSGPLSATGRMTLFVTMYNFYIVCSIIYYNIIDYKCM